MNGKMRNYHRSSSLAFIKKINKNQQILPDWQHHLAEHAPFLIACGILVFLVSLQNPTLLLFVLLGSFVTVIGEQIRQQFPLSKQWVMPLQILVVAFVLAIFLIDHTAAPASAQFFGKAEEFFKTTLTEGTEGANTETAVSLVFNVLRALYLLYIAVALIGVVNAVRKDEDWQTVARTPLLVVVAVTIADVLTGFIIGDGGSGGNGN